MQDRKDELIYRLKDIGAQFERQIDYYLKTLFPNYRVINDLTLYSEYLKGYTQIDNILITPHAVYVIEAKNWSRYIQGSYNDLYWVGQGKGKNAIKVINVYDQNLLHIRCIRNNLLMKGLIGAPFINYIVLPDNTNLYTTCSEVCNFSKLGTLIMQEENRHCKNCIDMELYYSEILKLQRR